MSPWWRRLVQDEDRYSPQELIFRGGGLALVAAFEFFFAFRQFSDDETWFGACYLALGLWFAFLAVKDFVEAWKGWGQDSGSAQGGSRGR